MPQESGRDEQIHRAFDLLIRTTRLHHRNIEKQFSDKGLPRGQRRILMHLSHTGELPSQREIASHFDISAACVARMLKSLAGEGYITRTGDEDDLRRNQVRITEKGLQTVSETRQAFDLFDQKMFENFSDEELADLIRLTGKLHDNLHACETGAEESIND